MKKILGSFMIFLNPLLIIFIFFGLLTLIGLHKIASYLFNFGDIFDSAIKDTVNDVLIKGEIPDITLSETDNLGEVVEKLCILHIRTWMLEDAAQEAITDEELGSLKRKIDICFKQKRPRLVQAINRQVSDAIVNNTSLVEDSVKLYKGVQ